MKPRIITISFLLSVVLLSGCLSAHLDKRTISQWIPPGTSLEDAIGIMKQHGYESDPCGRGSLLHPEEGNAVFCFTHETKILKNTRFFFVHFKNGKAVSIDGIGTGNNFFAGHHIKS